MQPGRGGGGTAPIGGPPLTSPVAMATRTAAFVVSIRRVAHLACVHTPRTRTAVCAMRCCLAVQPTHYPGRRQAPAGAEPTHPCQAQADRSCSRGAVGRRIAPWHRYARIALSLMSQARQLREPLTLEQFRQIRRLQRLRDRSGRVWFSALVKQQPENGWGVWGEGLTTSERVDNMSWGFDVPHGGQPRSRPGVPRRGAASPPGGGHLLSAALFEHVLAGLRCEDLATLGW